MIKATMPPADISPQERGTSYPLRAIIGTRTAASATVSATAEPDRLAMRTAGQDGRHSRDLPCDGRKR